MSLSNVIVDKDTEQESNSTRKISDLLNRIFDVEERDKISSIPKIIFLDTCHGDARNYKDIKFISRSGDSPCQSQKDNSIPNTRPGEGKFPKPKAGSLPRESKNRPTNDKSLENFIIFHASVEQNFGWQDPSKSPASSSYFLKGKCPNVYI